MHTLCPGRPSGTLPVMKTVSGFVCVLLAAGVVAGCGVAPADPTKGARVVDVVASANQWGDVVRQIGGRHADVASIVSSPDQDPHLYTSSPRDAARLARANLVVLNGLGYDDWAHKLLGAQPSSQRQVLTISDALKPTGSNPHLWYGVPPLPDAARAIADPPGALGRTGRPRDGDAAAGPHLPAMADRPGAGAAHRARKPMTAAVAELRGAAMRVGGRTLWDGLDLEVRPGEFLAVLGPNGAGKTTLLKVLLGLAELNAGTATVVGLPPQDGRERIGYVPQLRAFDRGFPLRGRDLVRLGFAGPRQQAQAAVSAALEAVGATGYADKPIGLL